MRSAWIVVCVLASTAHAESPDFARDVRPILANHCFQCHGPDAATRKAKLRLDTPEGAKASLGTVNASEVLNRIESKDDEALMPPPHIKKPLTDQQKRILKDWIAAGAAYAQHWAFVPPRRPDIRNPQSKNLNPIDHFILERLARDGLKPSPPADKPTLIRRVTLDLTGLPPTPDEVEAFVRDTAPDAYDKLVDRLLASPRYGERWARKWLDLARYADTNGYEKDRPRTIWPYRDWVIRALNEDMPFDQFTIAQIAGDLLPNPTTDQIVATGFHRNTMLNEEGGIDPLEFRYYAVVDRVNTTATTWLGLTLGCAQCHTHKFDPIPHTDYFRFLAFLNNTEEPEFEVLSPEQRKTKERIESAIRTREREAFAKLNTEPLKAKFAAWQAAEKQQLLPWTILRPSATEAGPTKLKRLDDGSLLALGDPTKADVYELEFTSWPAGVTAIRLEAKTDPSLPASGPGRAYYEGPKGDFLLSDIRLAVDGQPVQITAASDSFSGAKSNAKLAFDDNLQSGWAGRGPGQPSHAIFQFARPTTGANAKLTLRFERHYSASLGRFRIAATTAQGNVVARDFAVDAEEALRRGESSEPLFREFLRLSADMKSDRDAIEQLRAGLPRGPRTLVMAERPAEHPRKTFRHHRGEFLQPAEELQPGGLSILHPLPPNARINRLAFAQWLVSRNNPLVARVTVNRAWAAFFGKGIVRTVDDFGYQGELPTHPELLDWLAVEFMDSGWSMKQLHRRIVTSATYRQSSKVQPDHLTKDFDNKLLARFPRVRLEAEMIRDSALLASGLLSSKIGGPSVFPPQPAGVQETAYGGAQWTPSTGEDRYRRGLYTYAKRTAPFAMAATFDGPSGEACTAKREVSNTPLQALTLLNDPSMMEAAGALGKLLARETGTAQHKIDRIIRRCLARPARDHELTMLMNFAEKLSGDETARWTAVARAVMNLDEFVTKE